RCTRDVALELRLGRALFGSGRGGRRIDLGGRRRGERQTDTHDDRGNGTRGGHRSGRGGELTERRGQRSALVLVLTGLALLCGDLPARGGRGAGEVEGLGGSVELIGRLRLAVAGHRSRCVAARAAQGQLGSGVIGGHARTFVQHPDRVSIKKKGLVLRGSKVTNG